MPVIPWCRCWCSANRSVVGLRVLSCRSRTEAKSDIYFSTRSHNKNADQENVSCKMRIVKMGSLYLCYFSRVSPLFMGGLGTAFLRGPRGIREREGFGGAFLGARAGETIIDQNRAPGSRAQRPAKISMRVPATNVRSPHLPKPVAVARDRAQGKPVRLTG